MPRSLLMTSPESMTSPELMRHPFLSRRRLSSLAALSLSLAALSCGSAPKDAKAPEEKPTSESAAAPDELDGSAAVAPTAAAAPTEAFKLDAWAAAALMSPGTNIGNTLENTTTWETGWGNPVITEGYVQKLAALGFKTVRIPVAWDTYAKDGQIHPDKMQRVAEVVDMSLAAGLFTVVNIHWDGGWIDSSNKEKFAATHATFSKDAEKKFSAYWEQIAAHFMSRGERLLFEGLNEETNFAGEGSEAKAYATLTRVNQMFIDTVRATGGNNAERLLIITGYHTDIEKTCSDRFKLPKDTAANKLFLSVHYYTPWTFCGLEKDADWGKVMNDWGAPDDVSKLNSLFDQLQSFTQKHNLPVFLGEYNVTEKRNPDARIRWLSAVTQAAESRKMVPVLWDTGGEVSRKAPYQESAVLRAVLEGRE